MAKRLKKYNTNAQAKLPEKKEPEASGVACDEKKCKGEMVIKNPVEKHPQINNLRRAICGTCGWRGWV